MKQLINDKNKTKIIGLLVILILMWLILYLIPELLNTIFSTILGNLILITTSLLVSMYNIHYGIMLIIMFIIIFRFSQLLQLHCSKSLQKPYIKEGFTWTPQSTQNFLQIQNTINRQKIFDINIQKSQASQEEVNYFNKNEMWPWSQKTIKLYENAIKKNPFIRTLPDDSVNYARTIYNEAAILRILSYQTKEGQFLLNGVIVNNSINNIPSGFGDFALSEEKGDDIIKCNMKDSNNATLERITYTGKGVIFGEQMYKTTPVDYTNLEKEVRGFSFLNKPCNPCGAINKNPDYSCPFKLNLKNQTSFISEVWQKLWGV